MASAGERISMKQTVVKQREFPTREPKDRTFKVLGDTAEVRQPKEGGASYVAFALEPLNLEEGEPKGRLFANFFLDVAPGSDGIPSYAAPEGFAAFCQALGDDLEPGTVEQEVVYTGEKALKRQKKNLPLEERVTILDPEEIVQYIKAHDGMSVEAHEGLKKVDEETKKKNPTWKDQNFVQRWILPDASMAGSGEAVSGLPTQRRRQ